MNLCISILLMSLFHNLRSAEIDSLIFQYHADETENMQFKTLSFKSEFKTFTRHTIKLYENTKIPSNKF